MISEADRESNEQAAEALRSAGEGFAQAWRCPRYTGAPCPSEPSDEVRPTLVAIERLTGVSGLRTCPNHVTQDPVIATACAARQREEHGTIRDRYGPPTLRLMQTIECIDGALAARERAERKAREKQKKRNGGND